MNKLDYRQALNQDIQTLKTAQMEILPGSNVYYELSGIVLLGFLFMVGCPWFLTIIAYKDTLSLSFYGADLLIMGGMYLVVSLIVLPQIAEYIVIKKTVFPLLTLSALLKNRLKICFTLFMSISILWSCGYSFFFFTPDFSHLGERILTLVPGFLFGVFVASVVFQMELARVGLGTLYEVIKAMNTP